MIHFPRLLLFFLFALGSLASAQTYSDIALQNSSGNYARIVPFAPVTVCAAADATIPCTNKVTTYTDQTLGTACTLNSPSTNFAPTSGTGCNNPGVADINGNYTVFLSPGTYRVCVYAGNYLCELKGTAGGSASGGTVQGTANQITASTVGTTTIVALANPTIFPGGALFNGAVSINSGIGAVGLIPDPLCAFSFGLGSQDQLCNLNGQLVWNYGGVTGSNYLIPWMKYYDLIGSPPPNGSLIFFNSVTGQFELLGGNSSGTKVVQEDAAGNLSFAAVSGAPTQALPASPLINQGASVTPVYAAGVTYHTTAQNWSESKTTTLTGGSASSLTLAAGHAGIDVANVYGYQVYLNDGANSEAVAVTGGTYTFAGGGTITFTPFFSHGPGAYTVGSASSGIQETLNTSCGIGLTFAYQYGFCNVTVPSSGSLLNVGGNPFSLTTYNVPGTIFVHANQSTISGYGVSLQCTGRGACVQLGDRTNANDFSNITLQGFSFRSPTNFSAVPAYAGVQITSTVRTTNVVTINTATAHGFRPGDMITIMFTDASDYWGDSVVTSVPTSTSFTYARTGADILSQNTPGVVALAYTAVLDNANGSHLKDLNYDSAGEGGRFNHFFDFYDDEAAVIDHFNNNGISLNANLNWTGSFIFSSGNQVGQNAPVITVTNSSNLTANSSNCVTVYNSNGIFFDNTVCQASGLWQVYSSNTKGNFQGAAIRNIYTESTVGTNPFGTITGSVTSGVFQTGEKWVQAVTGAVVYARNAPTGVQSATVTAPVGTPDNSHIWTGQTSLATYTPTAVPIGYKTPFPGTGIAGLIAGTSAGAASFGMEGHGTGLSGAFQTGGAGATPYTYWIVANDTTAGTHTSPMRVLDWSSTGTDLIPVQWPRVSNGTDTITYDVIRATTPVNVGDSFPYIGGCGGGAGGTCGSVAAAVSQATACGGTLVCSFQDVGSSTTSAYTINTGAYAGNLLFWPGAIVSLGSTVSVEQEQAPVVSVGLSNKALQSVKRCGTGITSAGGGYSACLTASDSVTPAATVLTDISATTASPNLKGRLNFSLSNLYSHEIITLVDANAAQTRSTIGYRPTQNANDTYIGIDTTGGVTTMASSQMALGAPTAISNYIGAAPDNTSFLERLTASLKSFKTPVSMSSYLDMAEIANPGNPASGCRRYVDSTTHLVTYLNSVGASCFGGGITGSGVANQVAVFTAGAVIGGKTDFLYTPGTPNTLTIPGGGSTTQIIASGTNNSGFAITSGAFTIFPNNNVASTGTVNIDAWNGSSYVAGLQIGAAATTGTSIISSPANSPLGLAGKTSTGTTASLVLGSNTNLTGTSGVQGLIYAGTATVAGSTIANTFAPTSGTAEFRHLFMNPVINQTGGANGIIRIGAFHPVNTALGGTEYLLSAGLAASQAVGAVLTDKFTVDSNGTQTHWVTDGTTSFGANSFNTDAGCETTHGITTLSLVGAATTTGLQCLPANSIIDAVVYRITTTITGSASFTIGDGTTAARFCGTQSTLTAGTTGTCFAQADQTGAAGPRQVAAAAVVVTGNVTATAGAMRLIVFYHSWTPPTS